MLLTKLLVFFLLLVGCSVPEGMEESKKPGEFTDEIIVQDVVIEEVEPEVIEETQQPVIVVPTPSPPSKPPEPPAAHTVVSDDIPEEIQSLLNEDIGFVYHNLETDQRIAFNEKKYFYAASTVKTLIAMQLMDVGFDLSTEVVLKSSHFQQGRGAITNQGVVGQVYSLEEVLYEMMVSSDNTATQMAFELGRPYQAWTYASNYSNSGGHQRLYSGANSVTAEYMADAMMYLHHNQDHYQYVLELKFETPDQMNLFDDMDEYAKKPGQSVSRSSYSQVGIVYDDQPFVFVIYAQNSRSIDDMRTIAQAMLSWHLANR